MKFRHLCLLLPAFLLAPLHASESDTPAPEKPGILHRMLHPFGGGKKKDVVRFQQMEMAMTVEPIAPSLAETRQIKVALTVANKGSKLVQLEFPTSQRIEVLIKNAAGKTVLKWSDDQAFANEQTMVAINPGERIEYAVNVATRDLTAGETYVVEAFFPSYKALRKTSSVTPVK